MDGAKPHAVEIVLRLRDSDDCDPEETAEKLPGLSEVLEDELLLPEDELDDELLLELDDELLLELDDELELLDELDDDEQLDPSNAVTDTFSLA